MNKLILFCSIISFSLLSQKSKAQMATVQGTVIDGTDKEKLPGVVVLIVSAADSNIKQGVATEDDGSFVFNDIALGNYRISVRSMGYNTYSKTLYINSSSNNIGVISLSRDAKILHTVEIATVQTRAEQSGDTSTFNASAYKTNPDATAEDLLTKMPGITNTGGTLKVNGEQVKKVFVDGKEFFGDDPNAAIKNLPAEIISKIQVYDRASDQAQFTGFDDGSSEKSINILTKPGRNNGVFGRVSGGYGLDQQSQDGRYSLGGNLNFFNGDRRISLVGLANNINQQNFSSDDLLGVSSASTGGGGRGRGRSNSADNFLVSQQGGITQTQSGGANYSDVWGKKLKVSGSYFFNRADNTTESNISRNYILQNNDSSLRYDERSTTQSVNLNHRISTRLEWTIDSSNSFIISPKLSYQQNDNKKNLSGSNLYNELVNGSSLVNNTSALNEGYTFSNSALFRHKFAKKGRTFSVDFDTRINNKTGDGSLYSLNDYVDSTLLTDQIYTTSTKGKTLGMGINYTEPLSKSMQLQFRYNPSVSISETDKKTFFNDGAGNYADIDSSFSNQFSSQYTYHRGGGGIRYSSKKISVNTSIDAQYASLSGEQLFPQSLRVKRDFNNILARAMFNYKVSRSENLRIFYRTSTTEPNISQLQNLVDNSNPLQLTVGNPNLGQSYSHSFNTRYGNTNAKTGNGFFLFANANLTNNYIGNSTNIQNDGVQTSMPVNLDGMYSANAFATYSLVLKKLKSNLNLSSNVGFSNTPSLINSVLNKSQNTNFGGGAVLGSNISQNIDFTLSYNASYNIANNSAQASSSFQYFSQSSAAKLNWIVKERIVFNTNITNTLYSGLGDEYNQNFTLWNASLGYKFLKNKSLQADIYAFDILNQNNSISRTVNDYYIEDNQTTVLQRFFMLRLTYTFRQFSGTAKMPEASDDEHRPPPPPRGGRGGGGPPPGGGGPQF